MSSRKPRVYGPRIDCRSLSCAPINEQGVVYLFGVLHDVFDFQIESVQTGFPDCVARRFIGGDRWEELKIEFEFESASFEKHKHNPDDVHIIICWKHNWKTCPEQIEIIELSETVKNLEAILEEIKKPKVKSEYNRFCQQKRQKGLSFTEIAQQWNELKAGKKSKSKKPLTNWQKFCGEKRQEGLTFPEIRKLWNELTVDKKSKPKKQLTD